MTKIRAAGAGARCTPALQRRRRARLAAKLSTRRPSITPLTGACGTASASSACAHARGRRGGGARSGARAARGEGEESEGAGRGPPRLAWRGDGRRDGRDGMPRERWSEAGATGARRAIDAQREREREAERGVDDGAKTKSFGGRARRRACGAKRVGGPRFGRACGASAREASPAPACGAETALGPLGLAAPCRARRPPAPAPPGARLRRKLHGELRTGSSLRRKPHGTRRGGDALTLRRREVGPDCCCGRLWAGRRAIVEINALDPTAEGTAAGAFPLCRAPAAPGRAKTETRQSKAVAWSYRCYASALYWE